MSSEAIVQNEYGTVLADRVAFYSKKGWFGGGTLEELPIRHVTSVRLETSRNFPLGIILALVGLFSLGSGDANLMPGGVIVLLLGAFVLLGAPKVTLNTAGGDLRPASGPPWSRGAAETFVAGVRKALFDKPAA